MVSLIEKVMDEFAQVTAPGAYLVDFMPFCKARIILRVPRLIQLAPVQYLPDWLPGMGFKKAAVQMRGRLQDAMDVPHAYVKDQMVTPLKIYDICKANRLAAGAWYCDVVLYVYAP